MTAQRIKRSPHWPAFAAETIKARQHCELSGVSYGLNVHHVVPFHFCVLLGRGYAELDPRNVVVLSRAPIDYHLLLGHLDDWQSFCPPSMLQRIANDNLLGHMKADEIRADPLWQHMVSLRPRCWKDMTELDKKGIITLIDLMCPQPKDSHIHTFV